MDLTKEIENKLRACIATLVAPQIRRNKRKHTQKYISTDESTKI
jgi:hypothetical protein